MPLFPQRSSRDRVAGALFGLALAGCGGLSTTGTAWDDGTPSGSAGVPHDAGNGARRDAPSGSAGVPSGSAGVPSGSAGTASGSGDASSVDPHELVLRFTMPLAVAERGFDPFSLEPPVVLAFSPDGTRVVFAPNAAT